MCVICGCNASLQRPGRRKPSLTVAARTPVLAQATDPVAASGVNGINRTRAIRMEADVLGANQVFATRNRDDFARAGIRAFNILSSPGSGKTTLLCASIAALRARLPAQALAVIEGDQHTSIDAERIRACGAPAVQVNTGRACHLDASMVATAVGRLRARAARGAAGDALAGSLLFIENVGNLVCPALWDLGEAAKIVLLSVTEGDDKPLKYPDMFAAARLMVINKMDLLPYVRFDTAACVGYARRVNPDIEVLLLSAGRGDGVSAWLDRLLAWPLPARPAQPLRYRPSLPAGAAAAHDVRRSLDLSEDEVRDMRPRAAPDPAS